DYGRASLGMGRGSAPHDTDGRRAARLPPVRKTHPEGRAASQRYSSGLTRFPEVGHRRPHGPVDRSEGSRPRSVPSPSPSEEPAVSEDERPAGLLIPALTPRCRKIRSPFYGFGAEMNPS